MTHASKLHVEGIFDPATYAVSYIVLDLVSRECALIDPVLDYDPKSGSISTGNVDLLIMRVFELGARLAWILETRVHADHLTASAVIKREIGGQSGIGSGVVAMQDICGALFDAGPEFTRDGSQFDHRFEDGEQFTIGGLRGRVLHTPGHSPACASFIISDDEDSAVFTGATLYVPDHGSARCDLPGGNARTLYRSLRRLLSLPGDTKLYLGQDFPLVGREVRFISTVGEQRDRNIHVHNGITEDEYIAARERLDDTLDKPVLLMPALQINMRAGYLPPVAGNGVAYLKIPLCQI